MTEPTPAEVTPPEVTPPPPRWSWGARFWFLMTILIGPAYVLWMTGVEGRKIWVVVGILLLIALCASLAHWLMGRTRR